MLTKSSFSLYRTKATPPASPPPPSPPLAVVSVSLSTQKWTCKATRLQSLATRPPGAKRPVVNIDPTTGKADGPHKKKLRTYLGIVTRDKVDVIYETWKEVPATQKDLIWEDTRAEFEIPEASDSRTKKKILQIVGERWRQFKLDLTRKWTLVADQDGVDNTICEKYDISKEKLDQFRQTRRDPSMYGKRRRPSRSKTLPPTCCLVGTKKKLEEASQSRSTEGVINPPSPIRCHTKWKMACTKKTGQMTSEAAKEITGKIASQRSFVLHGCQDVLTAAIGRVEHPARVRAAGVELQQLTQQIRDQLEESIIEKVTRQLMASFSQMQSQFQSQMQSQGLALPPEPMVGPSGSHVITKESCVDPSGNDPEMGDSNKCELYIEANHPRLVALGRVYEGSIVYNISLLPGQMKVGVEEVKDAQAPVPVPTDEEVVSPSKTPQSPDLEVDDLLYLMTLTIPDLFLKPFQVNWDATVFESIQRSGQSQFDTESYIKSWMQSSKRDVYLGAYLNGRHWQMVVILPKENLVVWFCSLHNRPDNYLKGITNSTLKGLDDTPQPKSKAAARWIVVKCNRQKGSTECGYYVMHWMSTIILGSFRNNWEAYFNKARPLEPERLKAFHIQWTQHYLRLRHQT
ncbi:hypothetical protein HKD37_06G016432 [Glycine soja]